MQKRSTFIDGLRGIAALAVCLFHALRGSHIDIVPTDVMSVLVLGEAGVAIFFVISGFVITQSLLRSDLSFGGIGNFILRRSIRLDPPYWAAIAIAVGFSVLANAVVPGRPTVDYSAGQFVAHLFYMQDILGYQHINPVFWTLCYEIQFYVVAAVIIASRSTVVVVAAFVASLLWPMDLAPEMRGVFVNLFYSFLIGAGAMYAQQRAAVRPWFLAYLALVFASAIVNANLFALISSLAGLMLFSVAIAGKLHSLLNWRWLQFLGMISYSLYLTHNPITGATFRIWYMIAGTSPASQVIGFVLSVCSCVLFAWLMYTVIEKPCIGLARSSARLTWPPAFRRQMAAKTETAAPL